MAKNPTEVIVNGEDSDGVELITGVINKALLDNGFTNVGVMSPTTGEPTLVPDVPSLMDVVRATKPHLFHQPVTVTGVALPPMDDVSDYVEKNLATLERHPNSATNRQLFYLMSKQSDEELAKAKKAAPPTAAELHEAAKVMSAAAHQHDHQPKDTKADVERLAQKALDAA